MMADAALGVALEKLLEAVLDVKDKTTNFKAIHEKLESRLRSPTVGEIVNLDRILDNSEAEMKRLIDLLTEAEELVHKCLEIQWWNCFAKVSYSTKLQKLNDKLKEFFQTDMQVVQTRDIKKLQVTVNEMVEKFNGMQLNEFVGSCGAPEAPKFTIGWDVPLQELRTMLQKDLNEEDAKVVVLSAPGGCGKTTLASMLCHDAEIKGIFRNNIFFVTFSKTPNLNVIVQKMFQHKSFQVPNFQNDDDTIIQLENLLKRIGPDPILLVLDDAWPGSESLIVKFEKKIPGYRILVTSRSEFPRFDSTYKLKPLNDEDAMALFRHSAFRHGRSIIIQDNLVHEIVRRCRGSPLALTVVGGSLRGQEEVIWERTLEQWSKGQSIFDSHGDLLIRLTTSIDALNKKTDVKEYFLDPCLFPEDQRIPATALMDMWMELYNPDEIGIDALSKIHELASRNLVNLLFTRKDASGIDGYYNEHFVTQHDLLRDLAIYQNNQEHIKQRKRLILDVRGNDPPKWSIEQIQPFDARLLSVSTMCADETFSSSWNNMFSSRWFSFLCKSFLYLKKYKHLPEVEVLILNFRTKNYSLPKFMEEMDHLKVLIITNYGFYPAELSNFQLLGLLSGLKRIRLEHVSISFLSESRLQFRNLRKISLDMCKIGETFTKCTFNFAHMFPNVVEIDIHCCSDLVELPEGFCDIICLKKLSITKCNDLVVLPQNLGRLTNLEVLRLHSCTGLMGLPESVVSLHKLRFLDISDCLTISKLPDSVGDLCSLKKLDMRGCELRQLPPSVKDLGQLKDVICNEDMVDLWDPFKIHLNNLSISVLEEDKNLNWLPSLHH